MNDDYIKSLEQTIERKKAELEQMYKDGVKMQKCIALREEISRKIRTLQQYQKAKKK